MPREQAGGGTGFRKSQARAVLEGLIRTMAPRMVGKDTLRAVVRELAGDGALWADLELQLRPVDVVGEASTPALSPVLTAPIAAPVKLAWEHRCDTDDRLYRLTNTEQCGKCGERRP